ncbi:MAG: NADH-quinone oxidoreductase subunit M [SAR202 cluster bacterium]|nr:NADH-quinone oxidoreductase subunit M [SAR202 cluster bacterium]
MAGDGIHGILTTIVFLPLVGALLIAAFVRGDKRVRAVAGAIALAELILSVVVFAGYDRTAGGVQFVDRVSNWIPISSLNVEYLLGVDGLSAPMVLLTGLLGFVAIIGSFNVKLRVREYFVWLLILQTAVMGVFTSLDFILFFLLWELELVPMYFLISIWGSGRREYSAMKFLIFTFLGSAFMLVGILVLFFSTGTFDMTALPEKIAAAKLLLPAGAIFGLLFVGFAIKLPVWPLHTWLPDAHTDAPTAVSVMLAGVLLKMGGYGMIRITGAMFPEVMVDLAWLLAAAGIMNIIYGAIVTIRQTDLKRLVAFSSISHMGFVLLGLSAIAGSGSSVGLTGAALQMFTHGTITGLMFLVVGMVYDRAHTRYIPDLGGLASRMPVLAISFIIAGLASLGLPGTSGFVAEILIFLGAFPAWSWITAFAATGVVITAGYILWMVQRTMFGPKLERWDALRDPKPWEFVPVAVLVAMIFIVGIYPAVVSDLFRAGVEPIVQAAQGIQQAAASVR